MNILLLLDSILTGFGIIALLFIIIYLIGRAKASLWFLVACGGLIIGIMIYLMRDL